MTDVILVDSSYTTFYRFFATMRWFSLAKKEIYKEHKDDNKYDWSKNEIFFEFTFIFKNAERTMNRVLTLHLKMV